MNEKRESTESITAQLADMVAIIFGYSQLETGVTQLVEMALQKKAWDNIILRQCWYMYREEKCFLSR